MNVTLIGMPGAGKSTIGRSLAGALRYKVVDIDDEIARSQKRESYVDVLAEEGERGFLRIEEREALRLRCTDTVICPGGSIVYSPRAMDHLRKLSTVIYLVISVEEVKRRIDVRSRGIVGMGRKSIEGLYRERARLYSRYADAVVNVEGIGVAEAVRLIRRCLPGAVRRP